MAGSAPATATPWAALGWRLPGSLPGPGLCPLISVDVAIRCPWRSDFCQGVGATLARRTELLQLGEEPGMFPLALGLVGTRCGVTRRSEECVWHRDQRVLIMMGGGKREEEGERGRGERLRR